MNDFHKQYGDITTHKGSGDHDNRYALKNHNHDSVYSKTSHTHAWSAITGKPSTFSPTSHTHDDRYYTESETNNKLKDIVVMKSFKSGNASVSAKGTKEMTVSISVPNGYKFLAVSNLATNNEVCPSYFSWKDGNTLHVYVINPWDSAKTLSVTAEVQFIKS